MSHPLTLSGKRSSALLPSFALNPCHLQRSATTQWFLSQTWPQAVTYPSISSPSWAITLFSKEHLIQCKVLSNGSLGWWQLGKSGPRRQPVLFQEGESGVPRFHHSWAHIVKSAPLPLYPPRAPDSILQPSKAQGAAPDLGLPLPSPHVTYPRLRSLSWDPLAAAIELGKTRGQNQSICPAVGKRQQLEI